MAEDGIVVPGESSTGTLAPNLVEEKARAKGWKAREETDLPEEDFVEAKEFLGRQKLFDQIHDLKREISKQGQKFQQEMSQVSDHFAKMQKVEFDRAMRQLKAEKELAVEDNNLKAVEAINEEIKEKEKEFAEVKATTPRPTSVETSKEFTSWREENPWFDSDKELQKEAIALGTGYAMANPSLQQSDVLEYVKKRIHKIYPEKFETKGSRMTDNKVEGGGVTANTTSLRKSKGLAVKDLSEQEAAVMRTLIKRGALAQKAKQNKVTEEQQYLQDLAEAKGLV